MTDMSEPYHTIQFEKWNEERDGTISAENMERKLKRLGYDCTQYTFPPGTEFPEHTHGISKKDAIISGRFRLAMYGREVVLEPGDIIDVPAHTKHSASVVGEQRVVFFDSTQKAPFS